VLLALGLTGYLLDRYRVGGPVYREMSRRKELADELTPPPLLIGRVFLMLHEVEHAPPDAAGDADRARAMTNYRKYEAEYHKKREEWLREPIDPAARKALDGAGHEHALEVFRLAREDYFPKLRGDKKAREEASAVLFGRIGRTYREHSKAMQDAAAAVRESTESAEAEVTGTVRTWVYTTVVLSGAAVLAFGLIGGYIVRSVIKSAHTLNARVREMASGAGDLTARLPVDGSDEMAQLAEGINAVIAKIRGSSARPASRACSCCRSRRRSRPPPATRSRR
jgi:methyl-accepting chemotaxis protein WspA